MKLNERFGKRVAQWSAVLLLAAFASTLSAADTHQGYAKVRFAFGHPMWSKGGKGPWQKLERYMIVHAGDVIKCDAQSHADLILFYNNGDLQVTPNSEMAIDKLIYTSTGFEVIHDTQLNLKSGVVCGLVNKMAAGSKYEVKTPRGVAGIRGTKYRVAANGDVTVTEGVVIQSLVMPDGTIKTITINAGYTLVAATGQVREATAEEKKFTNDTVFDSLTHGGVIREVDPQSQQFFFESQQEPYISPIAPTE
jgi:hypothetical protein